MFKIDKFIKKRKEEIGLPPGTPVYVGEKREEPARITVIDYDENQLQEREDIQIEECCEFKDTASVSWINIDGVHDAKLIDSIGKKFDLHPLVVEDIVQPGQRPKMDDYGNYLFVVFNMLSFDDDTQEIVGEQVSLILSANYVLSFQERAGDIFDLIRDRLRKGKGRIRKMGADYLAYSLLDTMVDHYFTILEKLGEKIEELESVLVNNPKPETMQEIHKLKREMLYLRKSIWPLRELIAGMEKSESPVITKSTAKYLRDVYDHTIQIIDTVEAFRDMLSGFHDTYLTVISTRMNEIMKVLTIIATIFIPLTFLAGIYGMNFDFMPELKWRFGYFFIWGVILVIALAMVIFFRRKKWL
jgi:magnesium transporter